MPHFWNRPLYCFFLIIFHLSMSTKVVGFKYGKASISRCFEAILTPHDLLHLLKREVLLPVQPYNLLAAPRPFVILSVLLHND